jgi:hypothetical protein
MPTGTGIRLKIIAITGETMMIRTLEDISAGYHQITLDVAKLPSGCYLAVPEWVTGTSALLARPVKFLIID